MLEALRSWLLKLLAKDEAANPAAPAELPPAKAADRDTGREVRNTRRLERRRREAEERAEKAEAESRSLGEAKKAA
jgi:hypothetical protein